MEFSKASTTSNAAALATSMKFAGGFDVRRFL